MTDRSGGCLCGAVRYRVAGGRDDFGICHCKMCQRWSGGMFPGIMYLKDQVTIEGSDMVTAYGSSPGCTRSFCRVCGATLWFLSELHPEHIEIAVGTLDDTDGLRLTHEVFVDRKPAAWALAGAHLRDTEAEYLARIAAAREAAS